MNTMLLTVVGPQGRADVAAPADTPIAELLGAFADLTAGGTAALAGWELALPRRGALASSRSFAESGVVDGAILHLRPAGESPAEPTLVWRRPGAADARGPLRRTRDALPDWRPRVARIVPALKAAWRRRGASDSGRIERARATWAADDYTPRLDERIRAPRLRRTVTIAVVSDASGSGTSTVTALLATLLAHVNRDVPVVAELVAGGEPAQRVPARGGIHLLDCGTGVAHEEIARADQVVLVCDAHEATPARLAQLAGALRPGAPAPVVVVNGVTRRSPVVDADAVDGAVPHARGVIGIGWEPRLAGRLAQGAFAWTEKAGTWDSEVRELAVLLAADWEHMGAAAPGVLRSAG